MVFNWKQFGLGILETGLGMLPGGKLAKKAFKGLQRATGMAKDLLNTGENNFSEFANQFGDYKKGADKRMGDMEKGLKGMGDRVGGLEVGMQGMGNRMDNLEGEMKGLGDRTGTLEQGMGTLKEGLDSVRSDLEGVKSDIQTQGRELKQAMGEMKSELEDQIEQQSQEFNQKLQQQDTKFTQEINRIDSEIANLSGELKQQKIELKAEIQQKNEETKRQLRQEMEQQREQLENAISQVVQAQKKVNEAVQEHLNELDERMDKVEKKTIENARKIFEEKLERERKDEELADAIKTTNSKLENLEQEKQDLSDDFSKYKGEINQQTAQTQQDLESLETEYTRQTKILNEKIADNQDRLDDYEEEQQNIKLSQKKLDVEFREMLEEVDTHTELINEQTTKLEFVARGMEEIAEETHERINKLHREIFDLEEQTEEALFTAKKAVRKVDNLTEELQKERERIQELEQQIEKNKQETKKVKQEARWANERIDNLIKSQQLSDFTEQEPALNKLQKTLQLKADEAKLLAQLNILQQSQTTLTEELAEREWKVGVKEGTEIQIPHPEGMPLNPDSRWAKTFTPEQLREWGWDTRLLGDNETAPLTDPEKRKPETIQSGTQKEDRTEPELEAEIYQQIESTKSQLLEQLAEIQEQIKQNVSTVEEMAEEEEKSTTSKPSKAGNPSQSASAKIIPQQIQAKQQKLAQFKQELSQTQPNNSQSQTIQENISQLEAELTKEELEYELQQTEQQITENQQEILEQEWEEIQEIQEEVLEEAPAPELPPVAKLMEEAAQAAEAAADSSSESSAAQQNQMTLFMLYLIIFLMEYIVYKRNGLPGLVILNICLAIAYYKKDQILEYQHLWENYFLIIGYVMGNVLAYSAPEQEKYKMPSVIGFNAIIALLYAYTWYQKRQINQASQKELTRIQEETIQKIQAQNQNYEAESKKVEQEYTQKQQTIIEKIEQQQKPKQEQRKLEAELEQTLKETQETENTHQKEQAQEKINQIKQSLAQIKKNPLTSAVDIDLLEARESGIKSEWERIKGWLKSIIPRNQETNTLQKISFVIENLPLTEEEANILSNLHLTPEQVFAISCQAERVKYHTNELKENYHQLTNFQKLKLLNSGLEALGLKTLENKYTLARIQQQIAQEHQNFTLTTKEKENILRLLITTLNLTENQRNSLEEMGVSFFNASNWQVSEEQKDNLLKFGLERAKLTEEQEIKLATLHPDAFKTFAFSEKQKTILQSLASLTKEYKYSQLALELVRSLSLKNSSLSFFVNQEIIPDPNTAFGETKSPYLPLKTKFLQGEQKILKKQQEEKEKQANQEQIQADKLSIITSLLKWYKETDETQFNLTLDNYVEIGTLKGWQRDILLTCGLKTIPKYNFFELLVFAVETFTEQTFAESLEENNWLEEYYQEYLNSLANQEISINKIIWEKYASSRSPKEKEILANLNLEEIVNEQINRRLNTYQPVEDKNWEKWKDISLDFTAKLVKEWKNNSFSYETAKEWIDIGLKPEESNYAKWLRDIIELTPEQVLNESDSEELRKKYQEWQQENQPSKPTSSTSRYDDLFANLNQEEAEHQKKKKSREETRKKLDEQQFSRRQANLSEKDRKLKEEVEKRQRERELEAQEEEKKRQLREARDKELAEQEEKRLAAKTEQLERNKKLAEDALAVKKKEVELEEKKKREQIEKLEKANQLEQERLKKQAKLLEEETKKKLEAIALEDEEQRQKILKEAEQRKAYLEEEMLQERRKHERELMVKQQQAERERQEKEQEIRKLAEEAELAERNFQESQKQLEQERIARQKQEQNLRQEKAQRFALSEVHDKAMRYILGYCPSSTEFPNCVQGVSWQTKPSDYLYNIEELLAMGARINISRLDASETGDSRRISVATGRMSIYPYGKQLTAIATFLGDRFYNEAGLKGAIKEKINDPNLFFN